MTTGSTLRVQRRWTALSHESSGQMLCLFCQSLMWTINSNYCEAIAVKKMPYRCFVTQGTRETGAKAFTIDKVNISRQLSGLDLRSSLSLTLSTAGYHRKPCLCRGYQRPVATVCVAISEQNFPAQKHKHIPPWERRKQRRRQETHLQRKTYLLTCGCGSAGFCGVLF